MPLVSIREAGEMLRLSMRTIQRMVAAGTLQSRLQQGRRLVFLSDGHDASSTGHGGPIDPTLLEHLFDVYEGLSALQLRCYRTVMANKAFATVFAALPDQEEQVTVAQWERLYQRVKACQQKVEQFVRALRCDPKLVNGLYRAMTQVQILWTEYARRTRGYEAEGEEHAEEDTTSQGLITAIIFHLRKLLIGSVGHTDSQVLNDLS
jgi:hypothetical protein